MRSIPANWLRRKRAAHPVSADCRSSCRRRAFSHSGGRSLRHARGRLAEYGIFATIPASVASTQAGAVGRSACTNPFIPALAPEMKESGSSAAPRRHHLPRQRLAGGQRHDLGTGKGQAFRNGPVLALQRDGAPVQRRPKNCAPCTLAKFPVCPEHLPPRRPRHRGPAHGGPV